MHSGRRDSGRYRLDHHSDKHVAISCSQVVAHRHTPIVHRSCGAEAASMPCQPFHLRFMERRRAVTAGRVSAITDDADDIGGGSNLWDDDAIGIGIERMLDVSAPRPRPIHDNIWARNTHDDGAPLAVCHHDVPLEHLRR